MEQEQKEKNTHNTGEEKSEPKEETKKETNGEDLRLSGDDILNILRKVFRAGNSRTAVFEDENGKQLFKINLILLILIFFFIPVIALIFIVILITADYSISIKKRNTKS